jgi:hypothetical protein
MQQRQYCLTDNKEQQGQRTPLLYGVLQIATKLHKTKRHNEISRSVVLGRKSKPSEDYFQLCYLEQEQQVRNPTPTQAYKIGKRLQIG